MARSASSSVAQTVTPLPAARPSALTTTPSPSAASRAAKSMAASTSWNAAARAIRTPAAAATSWQNALLDLDPGRRRRSARRPARPCDEGIGDTGRQRGLGPDDDELDGLALGDLDDPGWVEWVGARDATHPRLERDRLAAGRHDDLVDARLGGQLPGQGVLAATAPDDEDPGRHDQAHTGVPDRLRIGRQARSMVWVRSGPTETSTIGTPAWRLDRRQVAPGVLGQVRERADVVDRLLPAVERLVDRPHAREGRPARWPDLDPPPVELVGDAQLDRLDPGQDVELVEHDAAHAVDGHRVAQRHGVEPADPARAPGHGPELAPPSAIPAPISSWSSVGYGPEPDPGRVRLHDADHFVDLERTDPAAGARAAGDRARRRHVRVAPVVEVEERPLRPLEQDVFAARQRRLDQPGRVIEVVAQPDAPAERLLDERLDLECRAAHPAEHQVLVGERALDPFAQDRRIEQVLHPQAESPGPVAIGRPDPAAGRARPSRRPAEPRWRRRAPRDRASSRGRSG